MNIPIRTLKKAADYPEFLFVSHKFWRLLLPNISLRLREEKGKVVSFDLPSITIMNPTKKVPPIEFRGIPSVLGTDFMETNELCLHFNPSKEEAFLLSD